MADRSAIEWTDASWTPIRARNLKTGKVGWHCEHATTGCEFCYAEGFNKRLGTGLDFKPGHRKDIEIFLDEKMLIQPLRWKKPRTIFVCSMTDLFADFVPDEWIDKVFAVMALAPQHTFQVLTKRAKRMREYVPGAAKRIVKRTSDGNPSVTVSTAKAYHSTTKVGGEFVWPLPNVWLGVSTERQQEADERIPLLLQTPAAIRFISAEPLLGPIDLDDIVTFGDGYEDHRSALECDVDVEDDEEFRGAILDWVITGGESGPDARPSNPEWFRGIRDQCDAAGVPYFHKQNGEWVSVSEVEGSGRHFSFPDGRTVRRVGKKAAGRLLDGVLHDAMPEIAR